MDNPQQPPAILSLCTGGGMLDDGLERAIGPVLTVAYVEIEAFCVWNLVAKMEAGLLDPAPVFTNLKTFPAKPFHRKICGIIGGYPCQPFSHAGQRKGEADERHLFPHICTIIDAVRPLWCFFENVPGHLSMGYDEVYRSLRALGYRVEAGIYSAAEVGATHDRERLFILAVDNSHRTRQLQPQRLIENIGGWIDNTSEEMGNPERRRFEQFEPEERIQGMQFSGRCEQMGNTKCDIRPSWNGQQEHSRQQESSSVTSGSEKLGDTISNGSEAGLSEQAQRQERLAGITHYPGNRFPAPQGHQQHAWEAPRVEPGLGFSIDGYNFREDLLRMAGNGVVPQTAAKAFIELSNIIQT